MKKIHCFIVTAIMMCCLFTGCNLYGWIRNDG